MSGQTSDDETLLAIIQTSCSLSILGSLVVFGAYYVQSAELGAKLLRTPIICLSICDMLTAVAYLLPNHTRTGCSVQALVGIFFPVAAFLYTDLIGLTIWLKVAYLDISANTMRRVHNTAHVICFIVPSAITIAIGAAGVVRWLLLATLRHALTQRAFLGCRKGRAAG